MKKDAKIYVAGHTGLVGSAIVRKLQKEAYDNLVFTPHSQYDLRNQQQVYDFFERERPEYVFLSAAKVGGILANSNNPAEFIYDNLMIEANVIHCSHIFKVKKLLFLGSSCIYPKNCPQPMKEEYLLSGKLEPTNEAYALAKISGLKMCEYYRTQYGDDFISTMPCNIYGLNDNYNLKTAHVIPSLIRKVYLSKCLQKNALDDIKHNILKHEKVTYNNDFEIVNFLKDSGIKFDKFSNRVILSLWGTGNSRREFLFSKDLAESLIFLMNNYSENLFINVGFGEDITIKDLFMHIQDIIGFDCEIIWNTNKPDGIKQKLLCVSRLKKIGWEASISLRQGLEKTIKEYLDE